MTTSVTIRNNGPSKIAKYISNSARHSDKIGEDILLEPGGDSGLQYVYVSMSGHHSNGRALVIEEVRHETA